MRLLQRVVGIATAASLTLLIGIFFISGSLFIRPGEPANADQQGSKEVVVVVEGEGETKSMAVANARRMAVETALGAYVQSVTDVKNFQVVSDEIKTHAEGYVSETEVLEEAQRGPIYWVKAKCTVSQVPLIKKLALSGLLRQWRIGVLIKPPEKDDFNPDEVAAYREIKDATEQAEAKINEQLSSTGFKTINAGENLEVRTDILSKISDLNALSAVASKIGMDVLIVGTAKVKYGQGNDVVAASGIHVFLVPAVATLNLKALRVSTREVIAARAFVPTAPNGNVIYTPGNGYGPAAAAAMQRSAGDAGDEMLVNIAKLPAMDMAILQVVIHQISFDRANTTEEFLKKTTGIISVQAEDWANEQVSYELKVTGTAKEAGKLVARALQKLKLCIKSVDSSKIVASGKCK